MIFTENVLFNYKSISFIERFKGMRVRERVREGWEGTIKWTKYNL